MIGVLDRFFVVLGIWIAAGAALATLLTLGAAAALTWAWNAARRRARRPSWALGRRNARDFARTRTSAPTGRTEPHTPRSTT
ncbi:hypothetical protein [Streptomyces sp. Je 1-369]|uniref:hypothetical protein n=1 Tax=Streptomyces sp. Je 1-369 TaxID=2966192 RepID=UPI002285A785|nr:hypothetical protein [Streptomyces sp. Je 1-369]WAL93948.1 hypothetical protein NOO62_05215 [Streptomyces sp. Je 1-369]